MRTTCMLIDNDILIDAGTGVADLSMTEMSLVDHVFVTHSHLDHVATIPFVADTVGGMRAKPLTIHAIPATISARYRHLRNRSSSFVRSKSGKPSIFAGARSLRCLPTTRCPRSAIR